MNARSAVLVVFAAAAAATLPMSAQAPGGAPDEVPSLAGLSHLLQAGAGAPGGSGGGVSQRVRRYLLSQEFDAPTRAPVGAGGASTGAAGGRAKEAGVSSATPFDPLRKWLTTRLREASGSVAAFRFEDTSVRVYGSFRFDALQGAGAGLSAGGAGMGASGGGEAAGASNDGETLERRRELVVEADDEGHRRVVDLLAALEGRAKPPVRLRLVLSSRPATDDKAALEIETVGGSALGEIARRLGEKTKILCQGDAEIRVGGTASAGTLRARTFILDYDVETTPEGKTADPRTERVPEGARFEASPVAISADGSIDFVLGFEIAQILKPVKTFSTTLEGGLALRFEIPDTNVTTWRSEVVRVPAERDAIRVRGIRWVDMEQGPREIEALVVVDRTNAGAAGGPGAGTGGAPSGEATKLGAAPVLAVGKDGLAIADGAKLAGSWTEPAAGMGSGGAGVAAKANDRFVLRRDGKIVGAVAIVRVEGALLVVRRLEGETPQAGDFVFPDRR